MWEQLIMEILNNHKGKLFGILGGLLFSILVLFIGILQTIFIACCVVIGYIIGKRIDESENLRDTVERFFRDR